MQKQGQKNIVFKKFSPPKYNGEEAVKIKRLHYVNQWNHNTKIIHFL